MEQQRSRRRAAGLTDSWYLMSLVHTCSSPTTHGTSSVLLFRLFRACNHRNKVVHLQGREPPCWFWIQDLK